jgi:cob(I)alamin adenosyltransferase
MSNRLTKIYTRTGDDGSTGLASGERVSKDCLLIKAQGDLDELNANIACVLACDVSENVSQILTAVQHHLFNIGGELSAPQCLLTHASDIEWLERWIDHFNQNLTPLKEFILPGGDKAVAHCHVSRTVCRRAERHLVEWSRENKFRQELLQYVNRLSDLLFVLARVIEKDSPSNYWQKDLVLPEP